MRRARDLLRAKPFVLFSVNLPLLKMEPTIKLLSIIEATTVTGPAKGLIGFCRRARSGEFLAEGLPRVEASIVTFDRVARDGGAREEDRAPNEFVAAARGAGIEVDVIAERFRFDTRVAGELRRVVERRAPDIVETHMIKSHFLVKLTGLGRRMPWVAYHHGYTTTDTKMRLYNRLNRWTLPSASRVITVCGPFAERLAREEGVRRERISVLHSSVSPPAPVRADEVVSLKKRLGVNAGERVVLSVGRLSREKGHADLVDALGALRRLDPGLDFKLVVVGDGPERERVEKAAKSLGLVGRVVFAGHAKDVRPFYAMADVLALPSHSEGSPYVLLEAMAAGVPVAATAVGGIPEIASDGETALLVHARDADAMASALRRLLTDAALALSLAARAKEHVSARFSPEAYARSLLAIYKELAPGVSHAPGLSQTFGG